MIRIVPAEPEVIYVPQYDPEVVYVQPYSRGCRSPVDIWRGIRGWLMAQLRLRLGPPRYLRGSVAPGMEPIAEIGIAGDRDRKLGSLGSRRNWDRGRQGQNNSIVNVVNINSDTARQWQPSVNSQRQSSATPAQQPCERSFFERQCPGCQRPIGRGCPRPP